ncbi:putative membrane protein YobI [Bacteroidia bacterium]|nr:putative membrane protein YobI [Bacteroidia bacterium]
MKIVIHNIGHCIAEWLKKLFRKSEQSKLGVTNFFSLSPIDNIENGRHYFDALTWALSNRNEKNIKNIALTGPYGSGKSSILQSFQKVNTDKNLHFLNISLATFKEEKENDDKTKGEELQRLIELSILQQLFYREKDQKLPDSRLKKITNFSLQRLLTYALCSVIFIISLVLVFNPQILTAILPQITISENIKTLIHYISLCFSVAGFFFLVLKSIRILHNLKISKLNIKNAEIEINPEINKSVLNHNLEEILYFFEVTPYNVVIIEDLDRFQETEIFTKLREVNLLINNSKKINKDVVFIYAVRDEMFTDKDRTKFFDFIIPVIPIINASNSNEILLRKIEAIDRNVSDTLIDDISLFIDEMRVLFNIVNEFQIYKQILSDKLSPDKLLAMVVYKNICPCDFVKLSNYEGNLYETISKKREYIKQQSEIIEKEIAEHKEEIKKLEALKIKDIKELRSLYILQYVKQLSNISTFQINNQTYNIDNVLDDDIFSYFVENKVFYNYYCARNGYNNNYYLQNGTQVSLKFTDIEKQVDAGYTYKEREQQIEDWNKNKVQEFKQKITILEQKKNKLNRLKISKLLYDKNIIVESKDNKQKLINTLLRNGYIAEDYLDYISLFHEGSLSRNDFAFLLNVKSQTNTDFNHNLDHIENLIKKIHIDDFSKEYILNYKLIDYLLTNDNYEQYRKSFLSILNDRTEKSEKFIDGFIDNGIKIDLFIKDSYHNGFDILGFGYRSGWFTQDKKCIQYFKLFIENADIADIKSICSGKSFLPELIAGNTDNYSIFNLNLSETKIKGIIETLKVKFKNNIRKENMSEDMFDYIYQNNHYIIKVDLLQVMLQTKGNFNQVDFDTRNYYAIQNSNCIELASYIEDNISEYINNVYLKLESNTQESEDCLLILLNNETLSKEQKISIIQKIGTKISDLKDIETIEIENLLLQNSKVKPIWANLIENFVNAENEMSEFAVEFLNNKENAELLSKTQIEKEKPDKETVDKFLEAFLLNDEINNDSYALILNSVPYIYLSLSFENLSKEKVKILIDKNKLELTEKNYSKLTENFENLHVFLIEKRHWKLSEIINSLAFAENDICALLKSSVLSYKIKEEILNYYGDTDIISDNNILDLIGDILLKQNIFNISKEIKKAILTKSRLKTDDKIALFNNINSIFDNKDITVILQSFSEPYSKIAENGKRPNLSQNAINANFAKILKDKKYISDFKSEKKGIRISTFRK